METTHKKIYHLLDKNSIPFEEVTHSAATTCEASAIARGRPLEIGGKSLLFKSKHGFHIFVLSAALDVDSTKVRKILKSQKLRFATEVELKQLAGVEKGALPPFGHGIIPFDLYIDVSILQNSKIAFNAGTLTTSLILDLDEYLKIINSYAHYTQFSR